MVGEPPGRRAGRERDRLARADELGGRRARSPPSRRAAGGTWSRSRARRRSSWPRRGRAAVHLLEQPRLGERVEVAAHGHLRHARAARVSSLTRTAPCRADLVEDQLLTLTGQHRVVAPPEGDRVYAIRTIPNTFAQSESSWIDETLMPNLDSPASAHDEGTAGGRTLDRSGSVVFESDRVSEQGGVSCRIHRLLRRPEGGRQPDLEPPRPPRSAASPARPRLYGLTAGGAAARSLSPALCRRARGGHGRRSGRTGRIRCRRRRTRTSSRRSPRRRGSTSRSTPSTTTRSRSRSTPTCRASPQDVFTWFAGYRMQFFASKGLLAADRRRLGAAQAAVRLGLPERLEGRRRALLLRPDLRLPVGGPLPQERVRSSTATRSRRPGTSSSRSPRR